MGAKRKRKHGRLRRWLVRPVVWALAALAVVLFLLIQALESRFVRERLRRAAVERLETLLGRPVAIAEVGLELWPLSVELAGVEISSGAEGEPPFLEIERALVDARSIRLRGPAVELGRVHVERPVVRLVYRRDRTDNLPRRASPRRAPSRGPPAMDLSIGELSLVDGALSVDQRRLPLSVEARNLRASLLGGSELHLQGRLDAEQVTLVLPRARPFLGAVALRVDLDQKGLGILSGRLSAPDLTLDVGGQIGWGEGKEVSLEVVARGNGAFLDQLGYGRGRVRGDFAFEGGWLWRPKLWGYRGTLTADELEVFERRLTGLRAAVAGDRNGVQADVEEASYGGGRVTGSIAYQHKAEGRPLGLELELDGVSLARLLEDQKIPLSGVDAEVSGPFSYSFPVRQPRRGSGRAELRFEPGAADARSLLLAGTAPLTFVEGTLISEAILAVSESQHALAFGRYEIPSRRGRFDLEIGSERLEELLPLLPIAPDVLSEAAWAPSSGSGRVNGSLHLGPGDARGEIRVDLRNVEAPGYRAERAQGAFVVDRRGIEELRMELLQPSAAMIVTGSIPFGDREDAGAPPFSLAVDAAGWPSTRGHAWLPWELPVEGLIYGSLSLSGDPAAPVGELEASLEPATIAGVGVDRLDLELGFDPGQVRFAQAKARAPGGELSLSGRLDRATGALDLSLESAALDLARAPLAELLPPPLSGTVGLAGRIRGTLDRPRASGELIWSNLALAGRGLGDGGETRTRLDWDGARLRFGGDFPGLDRFSGGGRLDSRGYEIELEVATDELAPLAAALTPEELPAFAEIEGRLEGEIVARRDFEDAGGDLRLRLGRLELTHEAVSLHAAEPVELRIEPGELRLESLFLTTDDEASELFVAGLVGLGEERSLDLRAQGSLESEWFELLLPDVELRGGRFEALLAIHGTPDRPLLNGVGELRGASALGSALPIALDHIEGLALFYPERLVLDSVRARAGTGALEAGGTVAFGGPEGADYQLDLSARDLSLSYPEGWLIRGDAEAALVSTSAGRILRGEVTLERAFYLQEIRVGFQSALQALFERRREEVTGASEVQSTTALNLRIRGEDALRVRNNVARVGGDVDFTLRGTLANPVLFGSVQIDPGGTLVYAGNDYEVERGELNFANPYRIEPVVDLVAVTDLREYDVRLGLSGSPQRLDVRVSANPPLPELEALALLTGGSARERLTLEDPLVDESGVGAESFLAGEAASAVTERVNRLFGLDRLRVSPLASGSGDLSSARVTLGERISRDLFVTYSYDPSTTEEQILEIEWSVSPSLLVVLTQNGDESYSMDLRWEKAF